ncbi:MAG: ABC transporter substrate-binding protein [Spartobacteria bacterium]|nr:ABC transporter substrate-binding protein [Spartobacteria bacterium]
MKIHFLCLLLLAVVAVGDHSIPADNPLASEDAYAGGTITVFAGQFPESYNYYLSLNSFSAELFGSMYETLLDMDPVTAEYIPGLASSWIISEDKKTFTFHIDERAKWSDGMPVTAEDVLWTFNTILKPENLTGPHKVALETFLPPEIIDERTIAFTANDVHWRNLGACGSFQILPKHVYKNLDFNKINFELPVVSGPYALGKTVEGFSVTLNRRSDWWAREKTMNTFIANFDTVKYRFFTDRLNAFEAFKKGDIDIFPVYTSRIWVNETSGRAFDNNWIVKQKVKNHKPIGFQGFAMNLRRPLFQDLRVRKALALLLNRERMNTTLMYNQYFLQRSYYPDLYDAAHPCTNPVFPFDKDQARKLLADAGWQANPETGLLEKNGEVFEIRFLTRDPSSDKFLNIYAEDLKDVGIQLVIDRKDWAAWQKDMSEFNYDMTWAAWGAGLFRDPEGMWASKEANRPNSNNINGFSNAEVDALIDAQKTEFDITRRNEICREIDHILAQQVPYVLLWNIDVTRLLYWNKFGTPVNVLSKFGDESSASFYWWSDEDAEADLQYAMENDVALPQKKSEVVFSLLK